MNRETTVTGKGFSTYVESRIFLRRLHILHCVMFCNALQQIVYRILYQSMQRMHLMEREMAVRIPSSWGANASNQGSHEDTSDLVATDHTHRLMQSTT